MIDPSLAGHDPLMARASLALDCPIAEDSTDVTDNARMERMIGDHLDFVWRLLRRIGVPPADLDDASQQVFLVASRRLTDITQNDERNFLYGAAVRVASNVRRTLRRRREVPDDELANIEAADQTPEDRADSNQSLELLDALLQQMPEELRLVFILADIEGLPGPEIARMQSIPLGTVASRLRRAREEIQARLARWQASNSTRGGAR